jgi:Fe-Mn family superoxide dismutase
METIMAFVLPDLPYDYDALAPYMSRETLEFHHDKHHNAYVTKGNELAEAAGMADLSLEEIVKKSYGTNAGLFNNAGQHYNHIHFWKWMKKNGGGTSLPAALQTAIDSDLGGYDKFRADFINAGMTQFGSGWAWLVVKDGKLEISKTPNGENPLVHGASPILGCDVWEHSYYIDYSNARPKYLEAFVDNMIKWDYVLEMYEAAS